MQLVHHGLSTVQVPTSTALGGMFTVDMWGVRKGKTVAVPKSLWRASGQAPLTQLRRVTVSDQSRSAERPSAVARAASGGQRARIQDTYVSNTSSVVEQQLASAAELPFEAHADDIGWLPGPVNGGVGRDMPSFSGPPMGARDPSLKSRTPARAIVRSIVLSSPILAQIISLCNGHVSHWQSSRSRLDGIERAFNVADLKPEHIELWLAVGMRLAALNPAIPAKVLWDSESKHYAADVDVALPFDVYQWLNRHLSFGHHGPEPVPTGEAVDAGTHTSSRDAHRKRRAVSDPMRDLAARSYNPSQHVGFDDFVRPTRACGSKRIRYKAAVHSGHPCEGLNCAHSGYFITWEEHGWCATDHADDEVLADEAGHANGGNCTRCDAAGPAGGTAGTAGANTTDSGASGRGRSARCNYPAAAGGSGTRRADGSIAQVDVAAQPATAGHVDSTGDDPETGADAGEPEAGDDEADGVNSVASRLERAYNKLRPRVGHCLWLDRGLGQLKAMRQAVARGYHITCLMQPNRVGLPRRYLASLKKSMCCPRGCTHGATDAACKRWTWVVLHKGIWELEIWVDSAVGDLVICVSSCTSAVRSVTLSRMVERETKLVQCPEGIGLYNLFGRGPTDGGDAQRKRLSLAARRRTRRGPKGALFDMEIGMSNVTAVARQLRSVDVTIWDVCDEFCEAVLDNVSMRRRTGPALAAETESVPGTRLQLRAHVPIDFADERAKQQRVDSSERLPAAKRGTTCCLADDAGAEVCDAGEPQRPHLYCPGCVNETCSGWYHPKCYWRRHYAVVCN